MKRWVSVCALASLGAAVVVGCATSTSISPNEETDAAAGDDAAKEGGGFRGDGAAPDATAHDASATDSGADDATIDGGIADASTDAHDSGLVDAASDAATDAGADAGADAGDDAGASPTVTNVVITTTSPDNGAIPYNTGTSTATITGTGFTGVACPSGVKLDDRDGANVVVGTHPASCTVDSDTQITAIFPSGIRTKGSTGWNVLVTNASGSNTTSAVKFVPRAGLLISEVLIATTGDSNDEFVEIYNPTTKAIDVTGAGIGLKLHQRASTGNDTAKTLTLVSGRTGSVPSHGFLLFVSNVAVTNGETWAAKADYTYAAAFGANNGAYISIGSADQSKVIDKVGWGSQSADGIEGTAITPSIPIDDSVQRKPAGGAGSATDTDDNATDFLAASTSLTPKGTTDPIEP